MDPATIIAGVGALNSLFGGQGASPYEAAAADALRAREAWLNQLRAMVSAYDPHTETIAAANYASQTASDSVANALKGLNASYLSAGGDPGGDTRFNVRAQGATDRVIDPLKQFIADRAASEFERKLRAFSAAAGAAPGDTTGDYLRLASATRRDPTGALNTLGSVLNKVFPQKDPSSGSGSGSGSGSSTTKSTGDLPKTTSGSKRSIYAYLDPAQVEVQGPDGFVDPNFYTVAQANAFSQV